MTREEIIKDYRDTLHSKTSSSFHELLNCGMGFTEANTLILGEIMAFLAYLIAPFDKARKKVLCDMVVDSIMNFRK